jgi:thiocyanate hydrolase subunit alpha
VTGRRFAVGDRVTVRERTSLFYTRTQAYTRGRTGVVTTLLDAGLIPEDEAYGRDDGRVEPFYKVRFRQVDLWPGYPFESDTLETEFSESWLAPAKEGHEPAPR